MTISLVVPKNHLVTNVANYRKFEIYRTIAVARGIVACGNGTVPNRKVHRMHADGLAVKDFYHGDRNAKIA